MTDGAGKQPERRRSVATRIMLSYVVVTIAVALMAGWSVVAQRTAAREADLMRSGYLPLTRALRDAVADQDRWNTQLNHVTTAKNPADKRVWFDLALNVGRPKTFGQLRTAISRAFVESGDEQTRSIGLELLRETTRIEKQLAADREDVKTLFDALEKGQERRAEVVAQSLVRRGTTATAQLNVLEQRVQRNVTGLLAEARAREKLATRLLIALAALALGTGVAMALYARRVLQPLGAVTERAKAVAAGDLTPRDVPASGDEIGELAQTFERMVGDIARANDELLAAERLATIGKMAAHVTHEVRNPLSSIALNMELLEEELAGDNDEARQLHQAIRKEVERLTQLTEQYLSMARRREPRLEHEEPGEVVREAFEFMRGDLARHGVACTLELAEDLPPVRVDEAQLKQALFNLMRNAREALDEGGSVVVRAAVGDGGVEIQVEDDGPGIDDETRAHLFEPFYTTKGGGTGLGLAITRQIIEAHGGKIRCEPRAGGGTRFTIELSAVEGDDDSGPASIDASDALERTPGAGA